jgi:hypothetical protein
MKKKQKRKLQKSAQKAAKTVRKHGPLTGSIVALGGFLSSMLASQRLRDSVEEFVASALGGAAKALGGVTVEAGEALKALPETLHHEKHEPEGDEVREDIAHSH